MNRGGILNAVLGGWKVDLSENALSGIPISVGYSNSPNRYLTTTRVNALAPVETAKIPNWTIGNRFPVSAGQNPFFKWMSLPMRRRIPSVRWARGFGGSGDLLDAVFCY